jgi:hypothetical protein
MDDAPADNQTPRYLLCVYELFLCVYACMVIRARMSKSVQASVGFNMPSFKGVYVYDLWSNFYYILYCNFYYILYCLFSFE